jgi:hypothetical protein
MGECIVNNVELGDEVEERVKEKESAQKRTRKRGSAGSERVRERASGSQWAIALYTMLSLAMKWKSE